MVSWLLGILLGVVLTILGFAIVALLFAWRFFLNPNPDFSKSGRIPLLKPERLSKVIYAVFPKAPARSYIRVCDVTPFNDSLSAEYFIRSVGNKAGKHRYRGELRLPPFDGEKQSPAANLEDAIEIMKGLGLGYERIEKSHGGIWFLSGVTDDLEKIAGAIDGFRRYVLDVKSTKSMTVSWHIPGQPA